MGMMSANDHAHSWAVWLGLSFSWNEIHDFRPFSNIINKLVWTGMNEKWIVSKVVVVQLNKSWTACTNAGYYLRVHDWLQTVVHHATLLYQNGNLWSLLTLSASGLLHSVGCDRVMGIEATLKESNWVKVPLHGRQVSKSRSFESLICPPDFIFCDRTDLLSTSGK